MIYNNVAYRIQVKILGDTFHLSILLDFFMDAIEFISLSFNCVDIQCSIVFFSDSRDRQKVLTWIRKLDGMNDDEGILERVHYIRYLVSTLSGTLGLVEPFTSMPPKNVKPLQLVLPPTVYADLLKDQPEPCLRKKLYAHKMPNPNSRFLQDKKFYEQQLFPPEGIICYAAAFSVI